MRWALALGMIPLLARADDIVPITKTDVVVVGGGAAGTYAAIQLHDLGKDVVLIEKKSRIGGHVDSYVDPATGAVRNFGVQIFYDLPEVHAYFERLGVNLTRRAGGGGGATSLPYDFRTGKLVNFTAPSGAETGAAFAKLSQILATNYSYLDDGFSLPNPVPEDLLLTFGEFAEKYGLGAIVNTLNSFNAPNEAWKELVLYTVKSFPRALVNSLLTGNLFATNDVMDLYRSAASVLGSRLLLQSSIVSVVRSDNGVTVTVDTPAGPRIIQANKILMTGYPLASNLAGWDLSCKETSLFKRFSTRSYFGFIIRHPGLNGSFSLTNVAPDQPYGVPPLPASLQINSLGPNFSGNTYGTYVASTKWITLDKAKEILAAGFDRLVSNGVIAPGKLEILEASDHSPFKLQVSEEEIRNGFYSQLYSLQGTKSTWWSGAAFHAQDSSGLWHFTKNLVNTLVST